MNDVIRYVAPVALAVALSSQNLYALRHLESSITCQDYARELSIIDKKIRANTNRLEILRKPGKKLELEVVKDILQKDKKDREMVMGAYELCELKRGESRIS